MNRNQWFQLPHSHFTSFNKRGTINDRISPTFAGVRSHSIAFGSNTTISTWYCGGTISTNDLLKTICQEYKAPTEPRTGESIQARYDRGERENKSKENSKRLKVILVLRTSGSYCCPLFP